MRQAAIAHSGEFERRQTFLVASWAAVSILLGGGGSPNPLSETILQIVCAALLAIYCVLEGRGAGRQWSRQVAVIIAFILLVPVVQLFPLPPVLWQALPGRELEHSALALIGESESWRPLSIAPHLTLASLLAMVPPAALAIIVARLSQHGRRVVLATVALMAFGSAVLGSFQMAGPGDALRLYPETSLGWLTGFHANRNAAADVLLIGALAGGAWFVGSPGQRTGDKSGMLVLAGFQLVVLTALLFTGSRAGIALLVIAMPSLGLMVWSKPAGRTRTLMATLAVIAILVAVLAFLDSRLGFVASRFGSVQDYRLGLWRDSWAAMLAYWPWGSGIGTFVPAFLPHESLAMLDPTLPNRAHNDYLELAIEAGLPGMLVLAAIAALILRLAVGCWKNAEHPRAMTIFGLQSFILIALHACVDYPLRNMAVASLAGIALGMLAPLRSKAAG